ncbi:MAG: argininosuccinate lyase [Planctomycetota bacterium]|nr:MAG: argininosuccinate lyase [Planctomycetota bacterium]
MTAPDPEHVKLDAVAPAAAPAAATLGAGAGAGLLRGRFAGGVHPALHAINRSLEFDLRLWREDLAGSRAHARMLGATGILPRASVSAILAGLDQVQRELEQGSFVPQPADEDVHMAVERRLTELIGEDGRRLHTARSRNDQVATDLALHLRGAVQEARAGVARVQRALLELVARDGEAVLPYYTHLQRAQPVHLGHTLLAYVEMLALDADALDCAPQRCPLGAGAGTGTGFPIDAQLTASELGFAAPEPNSLAAVASRQHATRFAAALAGTAVTLSRLGGELVLWCSREFGFARLGDAVSTGSSIMPQKRNPDGAELLRGKAVRVASAHATLLELQRGLPMGYFKDLQEDKPALFDAEDQLGQMLAVAEAMLRDIAFDRDAMRAAVDEAGGHLLATEAADWLVRQGVPFRQAHGAVGALVRAADARGVGLAELSDAELRACDPALGPGVRAALSVEAALNARSSVGGACLQNVRAQAALWRARLEAGQA